MLPAKAWDSFSFKFFRLADGLVDLTDENGTPWTPKNMPPPASLSLHFNSVIAFPAYCRSIPAMSKTLILLAATEVVYYFSTSTITAFSLVNWMLPLWLIAPTFVFPLLA